MNRRLPTRRQIFGMLSAALVMSVLLQVLGGWDRKFFWSIFLLSTLAVVTLSGYRRYAAPARGPNPDSGIYGFISRIVFWIVVTVTLFLAYPAFE